MVMVAMSFVPPLMKMMTKEEVDQWRRGFRVIWTMRRRGEGLDLGRMKDVTISNVEEDECTV